MKTISAIGTYLYQCLWVAKKSTAAGILLFVGDRILDATRTMTLPKWEHLAVGGLAGLLIAYKRSHPELTSVTLPIQPPPPSGGSLGGAAVLALLFLAGSACSAIQKADNSLKGDAFSVTSGGQTVSGKVSADGSFCFDVAEPIQIGPATCSHICIGPTTQICTAPAIAGSTTSTLTVKSGP